MVPAVGLAVRWAMSVERLDGQERNGWRGVLWTRVEALHKQNELTFTGQIETGDLLP